MSTNPLPQPQTLTNDLVASLHNDLTALAHKTISLSYALVFVVVLIVGLAGVGGYLGLKSYESQVSKAEARDAQYQKSLSDLTATLAAHDAENQKALATVAALKLQITKGVTVVQPPVVQTGLKPDATAKQAADALGALISSTGVPEALTTTPDGLVALSVPQAQKIATLLVDAVDTKAALGLAQQAIDLQAGVIDTDKQDLTACKSQLASAQKDIDGFKHVVKPTKWARFLSGAKTVLKVAPPVLAVGILIGVSM